MKIIALLPVKNEGWVLKYCLDSLSFVDEIIAIDDNSTDNTREILLKYGCKILELETKASIGWKEFDIRTHLLNEARKLGATHIIAIDGDESLSPDFQRDAKMILSNLKKGQQLQLEWINLCSKNTYLLPRIYKNFAICDDGVSMFTPAFLGVSRVPFTKILPLKLESKYCVFHYQWINKRRAQYKQAWYMVSEFLKKTRSPRRINATYSFVTERKYSNLEKDMPVPSSLPDTKTDGTIWQKDKLEEIFNNHPIEKFEKLAIWDIDELKTKFIKETGRDPVPVFFPEWFILINNIKNSIKNKFINILN